MDKRMRLYPPTFNTKELVQRFLLMGKSRFQICARPTNTKPVINIYNAFFCWLNGLFFKNFPVKIPNRPVPMAGMVDINPSGSCMPR